MVITNAHRNTAIVLAQGPKFVTCVRMAAGELTTTRLSQEEYEEDQFHPIEYPLLRAIDIYLNHPGGISAAARRELETLAMREMLA